MPEKGFKETWDIVEEPFYIFVAWSVASIILNANNILSAAILGIINWVVMLGAFGYIGYAVVKRDGTPGYAAKTGAYAGLFIGLASTVLSIASFYLVPGIYAETIERLAVQGVSQQAAESMLQAGLYANIIFAPAILAAVGAALSSLSAWFFRK